MFIIIITLKNKRPNLLLSTMSKMKSKERPSIRPMRRLK
jgi:hypothetical protein